MMTGILSTADERRCLRNRCPSHKSCISLSLKVLSEKERVLAGRGRLAGIHSMYALMIPTFRISQKRYFQHHRTFTSIVRNSRLVDRVVPAAGRRPSGRRWSNCQRRGGDGAQMMARQLHHDAVARIEVLLSFVCRWHRQSHLVESNARVFFFCQAHDPNVTLVIPHGHLQVPSLTLEPGCFTLSGNPALFGRTVALGYVCRTSRSRNNLMDEKKLSK